MAVINIDEIANELMKELDIYVANTVEDIDYAVKLVAKETAAELRETAPIGNTGDYAESWSHKRNRTSGKDYMSMVVYSKKPNHSLTHLLEKGHDTVNGTWVDPIPHIAPAEEKAERWMEDMLTKKLGG